MKNSSIVLSIFLLIVSSCTPSKTSEKAEEQSTTTDTPDPVAEEASVYFISPSDGDTLSSPFIVKMGLKGMKIQPAGEVNEGFGHHHILVNQKFWPEGEVIPPTDTTVHYGKGQTATDFSLAPGSYTISLQFADGVHRSYGESMSASIQITVE